MSYGYTKSLPNAEYDRYMKKLEVVGLEDCPYNLPADSWKNNPTKWPEVQWPDVYHYLIETPGVYTKESMKNFKSLEAHNFFVSGWVQTVYHLNVTKSTNVVVKADVKPSWRVNDEPHHTWAALSKDGSIISAHCDCMAGLGESCSHVGALLFKIEAAVRNGYTRLACTEKPCAWNQCFTKSVQPARIHEINFYKDSAKEKLLTSKRQRKNPPPPASKSKQLEFIESLKESGEKQVGLSGFKETVHLFEDRTVKEHKKLPISLATLYCEGNENLSKEDLQKKCEEKAQMEITQSENDYLKLTTKLQSESMVWQEQRVGRITASTAHSVLHTDIDNPAQSLIKKIYYQNRPLNTPAVLWGKQKESVALKQYGDAISTQHSNVKVETSGLGLLCKKPYIGASPDGIINCSCCDSGVVEIKCPFTHKDSSVKKMLTDKEFYIDENYQLKKKSKYYPQVQLQMCVFDKLFCHFVVWTTETCLITHVERDNSFIDGIISHIDSFWKRHCLPELLTHSLTNTKPNTANSLTEENKENVFCYCQKPWNENDGTDMIGCDNPDCKYKWVHLQCAKLKRAKKGKWYCKECRKNKK